MDVCVLSLQGREPDVAPPAFGVLLNRGCAISERERVRERERQILEPREDTPKMQMQVLPLWWGLGRLLNVLLGVDSEMWKREDPRVPHTQLTGLPRDI